MAWRLARSLETLRAEINAAAPHRSKATDGSIGDSAHSARASDHNPNRAGVVRAIDVTHDPANGVDCNVLVANVIGRFGQIPALTSGSYVIWQGRIWSFDRRHEGWRKSTGHDKHAHISVATAASGYDDTTRWGVMEEDDDMAKFSDEQGARLMEAADRIMGVLPSRASITGAGVAPVLDQNDGNYIVGQIGALTEVVKTLALGEGADPKAIEAAAKKGAAEAIREAAKKVAG